MSDDPVRQEPISGWSALRWSGWTIAFAPAMVVLFLVWAVLSGLQDNRGYGQAPDLFVVFILAAAAAAGTSTSLIACGIQSAREMRRGYTTLFGQKERYAQVDPETDIVVRPAGSKELTRAEFRARLNELTSRRVVPHECAVADSGGGVLGDAPDATDDSCRPGHGNDGTIRRHDARARRLHEEP